ncbi:MAG TPA: nucleoside 2-deoxyribosyltransferase [Candidatus Lokiarchaeia archaeon]|nr:nucleoside 2-deoxyribosyltransferase [Candidatus Lokiarchaeia archaeon]
MARPRIYLANPLGFSELGRIALDEIRARLEIHFDVIEPFAYSADLGAQLQKLALLQLPLAAQKEKMQAINHQIGERNIQALAKIDLVVAILDEADPGTAAEVGYAFALGKPIWGYYGDFRLKGDNPATWVNLQVQYFVEASGGKMCLTLEELLGQLNRWRNEAWTGAQGEP